MRYRDFFLIESWKNYTVSTNPEILLYDFYVVSYLTTLPLDPAQKGFSGTLIGREANEIKLDIQNAEDKLLPVLRDKLSEALFIAICAEIRHIIDRDQNYKDYENNQLLKKYLRNYGMFKDDNLPDEFKPTRNVDEPQQEPRETGYLNSFKAATKAIKDSGSSRERFAALSAELFRKMKWPPIYGGKKWAAIAEAYVLLNKSPQTNAQLQVAIDHAYDLQHNTGTVLNKVKTYYNKGDISWLKKALDFKANLKNVYSLLPKCSSDMRKLALEAFKTAGIKKEKLETTIAGDAIKSKSGSVSAKDTEFKVGDLIKYKSGSGTDTIELNGVVTSVNGLDTSLIVNITKIITLPQSQDQIAYDWKVGGQKVSLNKKYITKIGEKATFADEAKFKVGDLVHYVNDSNGNDVEGIIDSVDQLGYYNIKITKANKLAANVKIGDIVASSAKYMTKIGGKSPFKTGEFKVGDLIHYVNDQSGNDVEGVIASIDPLGYYNIKINKINRINKLTSNDWEVGVTVSLSGQYITKISTDSGLKIGDFGTLKIDGNVYEVKILSPASENSYNVLVVKPVEIKYKNKLFNVGKDILVGTNYLKSAFKSYSDTGEKPKSNEELKVGDVKTIKMQGDTYVVEIDSISESDNDVFIKIIDVIDKKYPAGANIGDKMVVDLSFLKDALVSTEKQEDIKVGDIVTFVSQNAKYEGVVTEKVTNSTLRVKVQKILDSKDANKNLLYRIGSEVTMAQSFFKKKEYI